MKVLQINIFGNLSTGKIAVDLSRTLREQGHESVVAYARNTLASDVPGIRIGSTWDVCWHGALTRITDKVGFYSKKATTVLIEQIKEYDPDIIHLHNLHGYYINIELLFEFLRESEIPVVWTLHDCWAFTGHCAHFENVGCEKWKTGCYHCPQKRVYPASYVKDNSKWNFAHKKSLFTSVKRMVLVTPSRWLADLTKESFLDKYPIDVIQNGIDLTVFKPTIGNWRKQYGLEDKKVVLGVAGTWTPQKGLHDFIQLAKHLDDSYRIVVVGVSKKQKKALPSNVIGIERTYNSKELAEIYTEAQFFVNPTYEDNFPTVNLEALACGTPVITYNTGGSPECIEDGLCGKVIAQGDIAGIEAAIKTTVFDSKVCREYGQRYDRTKSFERYIRIYEALLSIS